MIYAFTWQYGRRLSSISHNGDSISYTYDPDGIRTSKTVNGTTTKFHIMNGTLLGQTRGSDKKIIFLYDEKASKYGFDYNGTKYYYIFNVQGDVIGILNQAGQKIVSYTYDPWGRLLSIGGPQAGTIGQLNPIRYRGYYYDTETGFYYLQSRYYDPTMKRFLSCDSEAAITLSPEQPNWNKNLFAYCDNNPIIRVDCGGGAWQVIVFAIAVGGLTSALFEGVYQAAAGNKSLSEIDWTPVLIEGMNGGLTGLLFTAGIPAPQVTWGKVIINSGTSVAHSIHRGDNLMDTTANAIVTGVGSFAAGTLPQLGKNFFNNKFNLPPTFSTSNNRIGPLPAQPLSHFPEPWQVIDITSKIGLNRWGRGVFRSIPTVKASLPGALQTAGEAIVELWNGFWGLF